MPDWETILKNIMNTVSTLAAPASALFAGLSAWSVHNQTKQSNQVELFNPRMHIWSILRELMSQCSHYRNTVLSRETTKPADVISIFKSMVNTPFLSDISFTIDRPIGVKSKRIFLRRLKKLKD